MLLRVVCHEILYIWKVCRGRKEVGKRCSREPYSMPLFYLHVGCKCFLM
uniref:Uncharacterized protein n=1 Tax=Anguilla anguilla TaxID=7936 RepID=A0A0E9VZL3_ANGAN